jgi:ADP-L-glycero-D-manno-heptose 6-epimerase
MPIIVTAAAGFIGRHIVAALNARGVTDLVLVDRLGSDDRWRNLRGLEFEDIVTPEAFLASVEAGRAPAPATVIRLGACSVTTERDAGFLLENNYRYTRTLCTWALECGARFVYASSADTTKLRAAGYAQPFTSLEEGVREYVQTYLEMNGG